MWPVSKEVLELVLPFLANNRKEDEQTVGSRIDKSEEMVNEEQRSNKCQPMPRCSLLSRNIFSRWPHSRSAN